MALLRYFPARKFPSARPHFVRYRSHTDNCPVCTCTEFRVAYRTETACPLPLHLHQGPPGPSSMPKVRKLTPSPDPPLSSFFDPDFLPQRSEQDSQLSPLLADPLLPWARASALAAVLAPTPESPFLRPQRRLPTTSKFSSSRSSRAPYSTPPNSPKSRSSIKGVKKNPSPMAGSFLPYQPTPTTCVLGTIPIVSHFAQTPRALNVIHSLASLDPSLARTHSYPYSRARRTAPGEFRHAHNPRSIRPRALLIGPK
jgi:hypothetical protein